MKTFARDILALAYSSQEQDFRKYMLMSDADKSGTLNFEEFKTAVKFAQNMLKSTWTCEWNSRYKYKIVKLHK